MKLMLATKNDDKIKEIRNTLDITDLEIRTYRDFEALPNVVEDAATFAGNSFKKAKEVSELTGLVSLADDSGLAVKALGGAPGIMSSRYAGKDATDQDNNEKLLKKLEKKNNRQAAFICVMCLYFPNGKTVFTKGKLKGEITEKPRGENGFGYDPIFYLKGYGKTVAQLPGKEKNKISHRAEALEKMKKALIKRAQV